MQEILGLVRRCVTDYDMIQEGETVAVGVSGGKDSLVTLTALARLSKFYQKPFKVVAITVETGVPGMNFDAVAASANLTIETAADIGRQDQRQELPGTVVAQVFGGGGVAIPEGRTLCLSRILSSCRLA